MRCRAQKNVIKRRKSNNWSLPDKISEQEALVYKVTGTINEKNQEKCINQERNITMQNIEREAGRLYHASNGRFLFQGIDAE